MDNGFMITGNAKKLMMLCSFLPAMASAQDRKPNVIIVYTDDMGTLDAGCFGAEDLYTPNIDALARSGVKFTQFYAAPVSSVSRACLMTGQFARRSGLTDNARTAGFSPGKESIADRMRANGYRTALIGKWHMGTEEGYLPNDRGFDYFWGFLGGCIDSYSHFFYWSGANRHDLWENRTEIFRPGRFFIDETMVQIRRFIREDRSGRPFFLYWASNIPHYPLQPDEKWLDYYDGLPDPRRMYAAFISTFDERLGELKTFLEAEGIADNTVIIFQSDNGHSFEVRSFGQGGFCGDFRGGKFSMFEGGIRVPAIISWPGVLPQGEERAQMSMNIDWFPTIIELCGLDGSGMDVDGRSLVPVIMDNDAESRHDFLHFDCGDQWAVRYGDWKLIFNAKDVYPNDRTVKMKGYYLSNLKQDAGEKEDLKEIYPEMVQKLKELRAGYVGSMERTRPDLE